VYNYNWFNFIENGADPAHFSILHRADPNDGTWRSWFFNFRDIPPFDAVEMDYGMKVISRKPGPTVDSEYVDEKFCHRRFYRSAIPSSPISTSCAKRCAGLHNAHLMFVTQR
jgi:phenylpropionate dioxygenase-like ring-hydroxylating dioxygenase large terminal subunit